MEDRVRVMVGRKNISASEAYERLLEEDERRQKMDG